MKLKTLSLVLAFAVALFAGAAADVARADEGAKRACRHLTTDDTWAAARRSCRA